MIEQSVMYPSNVKQPLVDQRKLNPFTCCIKAVDRSGKYEGYNCAHRTDPRYYHEWTNAIELTRGGETQCGRPSNYHCNHRTYYQITGYRNTCPIAGCSGTYFQPAILQLELSKAHLANHGITQNSELHNITISFNHRSLGVDVANSKTTTNWGPNFCGFDKYPDLKVLRLYITDKNGVQKGELFIHNENPPLRGYAGVSATFTNVTYEDIVDGHINLEYQRNLSTNPGNIYIKDLSIRAQYTNAYSYLEGRAENDELYISKINHCQKPIVHIIEAGYKTNKKKLSLSESPKDLRDDVMVAVPNDMHYLKELYDDNKIKYTFWDNSDITGAKTIRYYLRSEPDKQLSFVCNVKKYNKPNLSLVPTITQNVVWDGTSEFIVQGNDICVDTIEIYIDGVDTEKALELSYDNGDIDMSKQQTNIITQSGLEKYHNVVAQLQCGKHTIIAMVDGMMYTAELRVYGASYQFEAYVKTQAPEDNNPTGVNCKRLDYIQNKSNESRIITIKRVDKIQTIVTPEFQFKTNTNFQNTTRNNEATVNKGLQIVDNLTFNNNQSRDFDISVKYPGKYNISIGENNKLNNRCVKVPTLFTVYISPNHKQNHDVLFVRGEDSTSFDYDYLVAWEGDNIDEPIHVSDVDIGGSYDDIKICVEADSFYTGLSQIGTAKIKVTNTSKRTLNNIRLELNVLTEDESGNKIVTLDEFFANDGIFTYLNTNFYTYNKENLNNVAITNMPYSIDEDDIGEENVELLIKTLEYDESLDEGDSIEIVIPYMSRSDKTVYIQPLLFGEPFPLYIYDDCESRDNPLEYFSLIVYDSILTDLQIEGNTDLLEISTTEQDCPQECYQTALTYKITNIDSSSTTNILAQTKITNDVNLIPYKFEYQIDGRPIINSVSNIINQDEDIKVEWHHNEITKTRPLSHSVVSGTVNFPNHDKQIIRGRTNKKGEVTFYIEIPTNVSKTYTLQTLLKNHLKFEYEGNIEHQNGVLYIDENNNIINTTHEDNNKNQIIFDFRRTYKRYKPGDIVTLTLSVNYIQKSLDNTIIFYPQIQNAGQSDTLTVYYKICNLREKGFDKYNHPVTYYNQGKLTTTFETDDYQLIENKISKDIYAGLATNVVPTANIEKRLVEQNELNIVNIQLDNYNRDNKEIKCNIDLAPTLENILGRYDIVDITIEDGSYDIVQDEETLKSIEWVIGEMKADSKTTAQIILKGAKIGLSEIHIETSDYQSGKDYHFGERRCSCE